jgi:hypothetical protein
MSNSMVDLTNLQTVNFGGGQTGSYDPSTGTYYDSGGNVLSASDLAQYGAFTVGGAPNPSPGSGSPGGSPVSGLGSGGALSGLGSLFAGIGSGIANATRPATVSTPQGTLAYNPATGTYAAVGASPLSLGSATSLIPLLLLGLLAYFVFKEV